ncbi:hypothetical protein V2J09_014885 [Rumex salicifolius]
MAPMFEYFIVCGIGPEIRTLDEMIKGFHGLEYRYSASLLDQFPPSNHSLYPPPPPQLSTCVLPAGVEFYSSGFDSNDESTYPHSYPIVLTEGDGSKIYVSCIAFRDPVDEDIAEAYHIPPNSYADKCICLVSRLPSFRVVRNALEEIYALCFSTTGMSNVPLPTPGKDKVLFAIENCLLSVEAPPKDGLPHADISLLPLVQCLDVDNLITLFTAVLLERKILLRSNKYSLLTLVSEAICLLIYPFWWKHVYIPLLFFSGVDYIDAPTPYMMGLHSGVDTTGLTMDGVVIVDLEYNRITTTEDIPSIPEPELSFLRSEILKLSCPNMVGIDHMGIGPWRPEQYSKCGVRSWGDEHDLQLRLIFLRFFASILSGYRNFIDSTSQVFNAQAFLKKRSRTTNQTSDPMVTQFLESLGFYDYLERRQSSGENTNNLLDKMQDAMGRGQNPMSVLPPPLIENEIITISDSVDGTHGSGAKYIYDRFPSNTRTEEQEEKRKQTLSAVSGALESTTKSYHDEDEGLSQLERAAERERMVLDIQVKLQGLWLRLLKLGTTDDPLSSFEYGTILALIESDAEGIGGSGFVECIREHINIGWTCQLTEEQFIAVKELLKTAITRASSRSDMSTIRDALEVSAEMYKKDVNHVFDYVQRHLISLAIWEELRFWEVYFDYLMEKSSNKSSNYAIQVMTQLIVVATHLAGLGLPDNDAWFIIETIAEKNKIGYKQYIQLRGYLSHIQQLRVGYWGVSTIKFQPSFHGPQSPRVQDAMNDSQPVEGSAVGRSWVHSMFSRENSTRVNSFSHASETGTPRKQDISNVGQKKIQTNVRVLRGHNGAVTAMHCVTKREVWDLVGDREDAGFFISGSTDCMVKIWDPSLRGSELRGSLQGHTGAIRSISSDRGNIVSGSDDQSILVWDKQTLQLLEELKGHTAPISQVRLLSGKRVLTSSHDGTVKMWDVRTDTCVATVGRCSGAVLCMEHDDTASILAAAGRESVAYVWDIRAGKQMHKLTGHSKWIRSIRLVDDTLITGSDDWTARVWSASRGTCDVVLASHAGPILSVEYSPLDKGIITGSSDGLIRFWENTSDGGIRCAKNVTIHNSSILSINASEHWLGIGAADNSMSLYNRAQDRLGTLSPSSQPKTSGWQLYRTPQKSPAMVRCMAVDLERKRICSGGRNGFLRLWDATINI